MPKIFDNIDTQFQAVLVDALSEANRADFCVGYFNLFGWRIVGDQIQNWDSGKGQCCRLLVGMQTLPKDELKLVRSLHEDAQQIDNQRAAQLKKELAREFREQLTYGAPSSADEIGLRNLSNQIKAGTVVVKLFLRHPLHAKLYLLFREDNFRPIIGYVGSSNLTFSGLSKQGELNVDIPDQDACEKLSNWFNDRWSDRLCVDISEDLTQIIDESWAREELIQPYHIYLKMAYHLSHEARAGLSEFQVPRDMRDKLLDFQAAAVRIAAHHLNRRNGVMIGDVVGLGKTLMATALARVFEDDHKFETLIICPKNLVSMWEDYRHQYRMHATVLSIGKVIRELPTLQRYRLVIIDESQNLRNREGKRYRVIKDYIDKNDSKCILLSATPYNKTYVDLSNQLRLFVSDDEDIGIQPNRLLREIGEAEFKRQFQAPLRSLSAFDHSEHPDDWRDLMRLYLVRRTRSFIQENYAHTEESSGRKYLTFADGQRSYFPIRIPKTVQFDVNEHYAELFSNEVVEAINSLELPRYGLANYVVSFPSSSPSKDDQKIIDDLSRSGKRLMGFCRTNLFKRLESSGFAFILSVQRHVLRNFVFIHALENELPLPIGTFDSGLLDTLSSDEDELDRIKDADEEEGGNVPESEDDLTMLWTEDHFCKKAEGIYDLFAGQYKSRFRWLNSIHFDKSLRTHLREDCEKLQSVLGRFEQWDSAEDTKLEALYQLLKNEHPEDKVLVFSQFADTVRFLDKQLVTRGIDSIGAVTGNDENPTRMARRFSPSTSMSANEYSEPQELRVLISTDVLSEGQNLQECAVVVNYDLPWAIIRLIQRAGRVDRIGQKAPTILCYSFLPADGIEKLIRIRDRVQNRLKENAEVVGTDEAFFEGDRQTIMLENLYNEKAGVLDDEDESDIDLSSYALQIWKNATDKSSSLKNKIEELPSVVYSSKAHEIETHRPEGVLVYLQTKHGYDSLVWLNQEGENITDSPFEVLRAAECSPDEKALIRHENHHELVQVASKQFNLSESIIGGNLGRSRGPRFRTYERLKQYANLVEHDIWNTKALRLAIDEIYRYPLQQAATETLSRQLRSGITDEALVELVVVLAEEDKLCSKHETTDTQDPDIICSLGLIG